MGNCLEKLKEKSGKRSDQYKVERKNQYVADENDFENPEDEQPSQQNMVGNKGIAK